jgi:uncharacterized membrane protein YjfL (UPF0719 family)
VNRERHSRHAILTTAAGVLVGVFIGLVLPLPQKPAQANSFVGISYLLIWWINRPIVLLLFAFALGRTATKNREKKFDLFIKVMGTAGLITTALRQLAG